MGDGNQVIEFGKENKSSNGVRKVKKGKTNKVVELRHHSQPKHVLLHPATNLPSWFFFISFLFFIYIPPSFLFSFSIHSSPKFLSNHTSLFLFLSYPTYKSLTYISKPSSPTHQLHISNTTIYLQLSGLSTHARVSIYYHLWCLVLIYAILHLVIWWSTRISYGFWQLVVVWHFKLLKVWD